jgi:uncharacterized protein YgbK (DUF1537 family)
VLDERDFPIVGGLIGALLDTGAPVFGVGSSGLQQALLAGWDALSAAASAHKPSPEPPGATPVLLVSGSSSPVTAAQIQAAAQAGFAVLSLDPRRLADRDGSAGHVAEAAGEAVCHLAAGRSVIAHTSLGPDDPRGLGEVGREALDRMAEASGLLARAVLTQVPIRRLGIAGGDTSSMAARAFGVRALEYEYRLAPGVPVCRVRASGAGLDGLQIMLKGGQMGPLDLFARFAAGR